MVLPFKREIIVMLIWSCDVKLLFSSVKAVAVTAPLLHIWEYWVNSVLWRSEICVLPKQLLIKLPLHTVAPGPSMLHVKVSSLPGQIQPLGSCENLFSCNESPEDHYNNNKQQHEMWTSILWNLTSNFLPTWLARIRMMLIADITCDVLPELILSRIII